jgi:uncharacterized RmlC-like cupin family protein
MSDSTTERVREREPEPGTVYDRVMEKQQADLHRANTGKIVMHKDELPIEQGRQGLLRFFLNGYEDPDDPTAQSAIEGWDVFTHDIRSQSGMHRHQGGLVIYVVSGKGHSLVEGQRVDWETGDLLLLPVLPGGVAHQHFNDDDSKESVQWVAFIYRPLHKAVGSFVEQVSESPDFAH